MRIKGTITGEAPHSRGGYTLQRRGQSLALGSRSLPPDPLTARQLSDRPLLRTITDAWRNTLTPTQRSNWNGWASASPWATWYGRPAHLRGVNAYAAHNLPRLNASIARMDDAPQFAGPSTAPTETVSVLPTGDLLVHVDPLSDWPAEDGAALVVSVSSYSSPTRSLPRPRMASAGAIEGSSLSPPSGTVTLANPFGSSAATALRTTVAMHLSTPSFGPAIGIKTPAPVPGDEPPAPSTCPCWPPPCGPLLSSYTVTGRYFDCTACGTAIPFSVGVSQFLNPCEWAGPGSGAEPDIIVDLDTSHTPDRWRVQGTSSGCASFVAVKYTGNTPVGTYQIAAGQTCSTSPAQSGASNVVVS